jgi:hypothetical protein
MKVNDDGDGVMMDTKGACWYQLYIEKPKTTPKFLKQFRMRFRLPYDQFLELLEMVKTEVKDDGVLLFRRWMSKDATGLPSSPIELMVMGSLRYLGRGWTFDDIAEATCVSEETHRQFFTIFIDFGRQVLYPRFVKAPTNKEEAEVHLYEMARAGLPGCLSSTDATNVLQATWNGACF